MKNLIGSGRRDCFGLKRAHSAAILASALAVAGCSADVTRFDSASFNLNDPPEAASAPVPQEPVHSSFNNSVTHSQPRGPYGAGAKTVEVAALPEPVGAQPLPPPAAQAPATAYKQPPYRPAAAQPFAGTQPAHTPAATNAAAPTVAAGPGGTIDVQPGDTLFGLAKRHRVSVAELKAANGLTTDSLKLGQKLQLPGGRGAQVAALAPSAAPAAAAPAPSSAPAVAEAAPLAPASAEVMARYNSTHTVQAGESLYAIARQHKINFGELQQVNGISDPRKVRPGTVLKVPAGSAGASIAAAPVASPPAVTAAAQPAADSSAQPGLTQNTSTQPTVINGGNKRVAALGDRATDAGAPSAPAAAPAAAPAVKADKVAAAAPQASADASDSVKLRWPATGKIIAGFGGRPDGTHNDGINLSVPLGTDVHAAESGVVAYAGSELKGYGNLVLVRHENGWVTAYAHNDELLVKRGDKVKRGQVIGKAGKTGTVDQPQVHFELRQGSKPVDPTPFMEKS